MFIHNLQITWNHIPKGSNLRSHHYENLKFRNCYNCVCVDLLMKIVLDVRKFHLIIFENKSVQ
jgi:hypothetical protein